MKEIVVGIDFSKSSIQAFHYAISIARQCNCRIKLIYVSKVRDKAAELIKDEKGMATNIRDSFQNLIESLPEDIKPRISHKVLYGKIWEELTNQAKYTDAELIITGAHGMSGFEELWVGNNTRKIISHSEKPVLVVNKNFRVKNHVIEKVVIPIDHTQATIQKIPFTIKMAKVFKAQVNVLTIHNPKLKYTDEFVDKNTAIAMEMIIESGLRYINEKKSSEQTAKATIEYATKRNADLISIMNENESSNSFSIGVNPEQIINQSPIPVLTFRTNVFSPNIFTPKLSAVK
jgi:nucleotide-binding universal stress UspA family protein